MFLGMLAMPGTSGTEQTQLNLDGFREQNFCALPALLKQLHMSGVWNGCTAPGQALAAAPVLPVQTTETTAEAVGGGNQLAWGAGKISRIRVIYLCFLIQGSTLQVKIASNRKVAALSTDFSLTGPCKWRCRRVGAAGEDL
jgi:hypothetical protein